MARRSSSVTIIDVAREAGVSKSAAARVLAQSGSASSETQEKVLEAARRLGYRPNHLAKAMKSGTTHTIGAVVPDVASPFFSVVLRGLTDSARAAGFEVLVSNSDNDAHIEARSIELLAEKRIDGLIVAPVFQPTPQAILDLTADGTPVVLLDRRMRGLEQLPLVSADHAGASQRATAELIRLGHTSIAVMTETRRTFDELRALIDAEDLSILRPSAQRVVGYLRAHAAVGLPIAATHIVRSDYAVAAARTAVEALLDENRSVTALHATDAVLTEGAWRAFTARGTRIPDDLSFIGFDDQDWTTLVRPEVSVMDQPRHRLGAAAAAALIAAIRGDEAPMPDVTFDAAMLLRGSAAALT